MDIAEGWSGWMPVLNLFGFTMNAVYYGDKKLNINNSYRRCLIGHWFLVVLIDNREKCSLNFCLYQVRLLF